MIWRLFRRTTRPDALARWWRDADRAADAPSAAAVDRLAAAIGDSTEVDVIEQQEEMIEGLRHLKHVFALENLPVLESQHRVIGADTCHFMAPVTLAGQDTAPGKLLLTSRRIIVVSGGVRSRPWHAIRRLSRSGRTVIAASDDTILEVQCNSYGDALVAHHIASRLALGGRRS